MVYGLIAQEPTEDHTAEPRFIKSCLITIEDDLSLSVVPLPPVQRSLGVETRVLRRSGSWSAYVQARKGARERW